MKSTPKSLPTLVAEIVACLLVAAVAATSCSSATGCSDNRSSIPMAGFYAQDGSPLQLENIEIGGVGAPNDSLLVEAKEKPKGVYLPLRQTADRASFFIRYRIEGIDDPAFFDTITFRYTSIPFFASEECGAMLRYHIDRLDYTRHLVDSVAILAADSMIINVDAENMKIFFKTEE